MQHFPLCSLNGEQHSPLRNSDHFSPAGSMLRAQHVSRWCSSHVTYEY